MGTGCLSVAFDRVALEVSSLHIGRLVRSALGQWGHMVNGRCQRVRYYLIHVKWFAAQLAGVRIACVYRASRHGRHERCPLPGPTPVFYLALVVRPLGFRARRAARFHCVRGGEQRRAHDTDCEEHPTRRPRLPAQGVVQHPRRVVCRQAARRRAASTVAVDPSSVLVATRVPGLPGGHVFHATPRAHYRVSVVLAPEPVRYVVVRRAQALGTVRVRTAFDRTSSLSSIHVPPLAIRTPSLCRSIHQAGYVLSHERDAHGSWHAGWSSHVRVDQEDQGRRCGPPQWPGVEAAEAAQHTPCTRSTDGFAGTHVACDAMLCLHSCAGRPWPCAPPWPWPGSARSDPRR